MLQKEPGAIYLFTAYYSFMDVVYLLMSYVIRCSREIIQFDLNMFK